MKRGDNLEDYEWLTVMTSEFMHLFLLKTFSIEIQIGVWKLQEHFHLSKRTIYAWLYYRLLFIPNY
jgi:hypothetical protein